jgi:mono/diheme cytochrome c family protein
VSAHSIRTIAAAASLLALAATAGCTEPPRGDAARGEQLHAVCLPCHGTGLYTSPDRKIKSLKALHQEVARWGDYYNPALTGQDVDDLTAYLNSNFYRF